MSPPPSLSRLPSKTVELWQPDHPALYTLRTVLADGSTGAPLHRLSTRFGFRETWFEGIHYYLNGIRCNFRGESPAYWRKGRHVRHPRNRDRDGPPLPGGQLQCAAVPPMPAPPHVLDVCDELGMLVIDESAIYASWQMLLPEHPTGWSIAASTWPAGCGGTAIIPPSSCGPRKTKA